MPLADQLTIDLHEAMRAGDTRRREVIRFLRAAIKNAEIDKGRPLTDEEIQGVIRYQIKQRREAIEQFRKGGREDLALEEEAQIAILLPYLPAQLSEDELREMVARVADELGVSSPRDMGRLMSALIREAAGRADGSTLSALARDELARRAAS